MPVQHACFSNSVAGESLGDHPSFECGDPLWIRGIRGSLPDADLVGGGHNITVKVGQSQSHAVIAPHGTQPVVQATNSGGQAESIHPARVRGDELGERRLEAVLIATGMADVCQR